MASWSYALSRMRIFCAAIAATSFGFSSSRRVLPRTKGGAPFWWGAAPVVCPCSCLAPRWGRGAAGPPLGRLLDDLGDDPRADGPATLADGEAQALVHGDRLDQLDRHLNVVARHHHLGPLGEV